MTTRSIRIFRASIPSAVLAVLTVTVLTLWADLQPALKDGLKNVFSHHWVGKGIIAGAIFLIFTIGLSFFQTDEKKGLDGRGIWALTWVSVIGSIVMTLFFVYETYWK